MNSLATHVITAVFIWICTANNTDGSNRKRFGYYVELENNRSCEVGKSYCHYDFPETDRPPYLGIWFCPLPELLISRGTCTGSDYCERNSVTGQPSCTSKWNCTAGHLYCGHKLKEISSLLHPKLANSLQLNGVYQCDEGSNNIWLTNTCDAECIPLDEGKICCNQPCDMNSTYCGAELNNLKCLLKYPSNHRSTFERSLNGVQYLSRYPSNNLYRCKGIQHAELIENCSHICTASKNDSYCDYDMCGTDPDYDSFPWMASIRNPFSYERYGEHRSDGILIGSEWVLSTASYHPGFYDNRNIISVGTEYSKDFYKGQIDVKIAAVVEHPEYDDDYRYSPADLALVRLKSPITAIRPVCLTDRIASDSSECILASWGRIGHDPTFKLQQRKVQLFSKEICNKMYSANATELLSSYNLFTYSDLQENQICGYAVDRSVFCNGANGMLMCRIRGICDWILVGLLTEGPIYGCDDERQPLLLFTDLSAYYPWIFNVTAIELPNYDMIE